MTLCPKCERRRISGPKYEVVAGVERLRYTCVQCGYTTTKETRDHEKRKERHE